MGGMFPEFWDPLRSEHTSHSTVFLKWEVASFIYGEGGLLLTAWVRKSERLAHPLDILIGGKAIIKIVLISGSMYFFR